MRRTIAFGLGLLLVLGLAGPAAAAKPGLNCPADASGHELVDQQGWWDNSVQGFETEGVPVYVGGDPNNGFTETFDEFAQAVGFEDGQDFYEFILGPQWDTINKNGDAYVCMKAYPQRTAGTPAFLFVGTDNNAT